MGPGTAVVVRMVDGSEWAGTIAPVTWWRRLFGWRVLTLEHVRVSHNGAMTSLDGVTWCARRHVVTVQVVGE